MKTRLLLFILLSSFIARPQSITSLLDKLKHTKSDTAYLNTLNSITAYYADEKNDSAKTYNELSLSFSAEKQMDEKNFKGFFFKAELQKQEEKYAEALKSAEFAYQLALKNKNAEDEVDATIQKGTIFEFAKQEKSAVTLFQKALVMSTVNNYQRGIISANIHFGVHYKENNEITKSLEYFIATYPLVEQLHDTNGIFTCSINLGTLYEKTKDAEKALLYYRRALSINTNGNDENAIAICYFKIGRLFLGQHKRDSAEYYLHKTMAIHLKRKDERGLIFDYSFLASIYLQKGDYKTALENHNRSMGLARKLNDSARIGAVYTYIADMYLKKHDLDLALENYKNSLLFRTRNSSLEGPAQAYGLIAKIYNEQGKYKDAYDNYVKFKSLSDSSYNINETKKQTELKLGFEFNQVQEKMKAEAAAKELVNEAQRQQDKQQRYFLIGGLVIISFFLLWALRNFRAKQKANLVLEEQKLEIEKQKEVLEDKQQEILDSILTAKRIQNSLLPTEKYIKKNLERLNDHSKK